MIASDDMFALGAFEGAEVDRLLAMLPGRRHNYFQVYISFE